MATNWLGYGITHGYTSATNCADCPHYAVDVGTPFHTPITALFSGTVVSQRTGIPWGTEVFIQPDNKSLPEYYYYHLDQLNTQTGQHLQAGQVIGLSGGQNSGGSNPTQPAFSSGPHTHVGFFTRWISTPIGTRPYGPDITSYVRSLTNGTIPANAVSDSSSSTSSGGTDILAQAHTWGVKIGVFVLALVLVGFGFYLLFQKQADTAIKNGAGVAAKVAL